ncbi:CpaD family pilus assembly protein [Rhodopseudomonas palustris]|uniref:Pilus assembly protein CpaD n=1 Tax=Rhodopseudomonas palustris (strain BisB18) TaxID=316056 RepID=Q210D7_RHOPB
MTSEYPADHLRRLRLGGALVAVCLVLGGCNHTSDEVTGSIVPDDYRQRHPIAIQEADQTLIIFAGTGRGGLTGAQRADVASLAQTWLREGTGPIVIDLPTHTPNARAAADSLREIRALLAAQGLPPNAVTVRDYQPRDTRQFAAIRVNYPRLTATAGPCGLWPDDLGSSSKNHDYFENKPYWNLGCASQRNLAAMVDNPADLVQPRGETPAYTARRTNSFEKYRKGTSTTTTYPEADKAKLSDTGK